MGAPLRAKRRIDADRIRSLIAATAAGNPDARHELALVCLERARRTVLFTCGPGPEGDDVVQAAMAKVFDRLDRFDGGPGFLVWVDRITLNVALDQFRRQARIGFVEYRDERSFDHGPRTEAPDENADRNRVMERVAAHLAEIKPGWRIPLVLSLLHGYSVPEIAAMLDLNYEAAKKRLYRGRDEFHRRLARDPRCAEFFGGRTR